MSEQVIKPSPRRFIKQKRLGPAPIASFDRSLDQSIDHESDELRHRVRIDLLTAIFFYLLLSFFHYRFLYYTKFFFCYSEFLLPLVWEERAVGESHRPMVRVFSI